MTIPVPWLRRSQLVKTTRPDVSTICSTSLVMPRAVSSGYIGKLSCSIRRLTKLISAQPNGQNSGDHSDQTSR